MADGNKYLPGQTTTSAFALIVISFGKRNIPSERKANISAFERTFQGAVSQRNRRWKAPFCSGEYNFHSSVIFSLLTATLAQLGV